MKRISRLKVGVGAVVVAAVLAAVGAKVIASPADSYLAYRKNAAAAVAAARTEDRPSVDRQYTADVNARLARLIGTVRAKGFAAKAAGTVQSVGPVDGVPPGPDGLAFKSADGKTNLVVTTVPLLKAWASTADAGIKPTDDVAAILDNETLYTDVFSDDAAAFRFAELPVKRQPADGVVKAWLLGESQDGVPDGPNTLAVSVRQGERVYIQWKSVTLRPIVACSVGRVPDDARQACFARQVVSQRIYPRLVALAQSMADAVVR
ncbi:hypothetical protein [Burkholderia diffusa]|uniref:Uncharacterized protein n=2 Tax=Burkholderia diffusa TaxID=488732 RepID=A0A6P2IHT6_9BURK|nr:hypothetical protein [Burkholderia diffusa]KAB0659934.1 hypothetical protein F7R23_08420 [Burkholderia diffusa]MBM2651988.1 hypothetical protein [Burkholderia diffusa]VWB30602.1 hypothetical protein BDI24065_01306 [Burkholderia diffusa]